MKTIKLSEEMEKEIDLIETYDNIWQNHHLKKLAIRKDEDRLFWKRIFFVFVAYVLFMKFVANDYAGEVECHREDYLSEVCE